MEPTTVLRIQASNFMGLTVFDHTPEPGAAIVIGGRNGQGKSSAMRALWAAIDGAALKRDVAEPVHHGADKAEIVLTLTNGLTITRTFDTEGGMKLKVEDGDSKPKSPQTLLNELKGALTFAPFGFLTLDPKAQQQTLLGLVELPFDPEALAKQRAEVFDQRTDINRTVKRLEGALADAGPPEPGVPDTEQSAADLMEAHRAAAAAEARNREIDRLRTETANTVQQLQERYDEIGRQLEQAKRNAYDANEAEPEPVQNLDHIAEQMANIETTNAAVRANRHREELAAELASAQASYDELSEDIASLDELRAEGLSAATFPVDGLGFGDGYVTFDNVPLAQCSASEQRRIATAIARSLNPALRVVLVEDGSLLDEDAQAQLISDCAATGHQLWMEVVGTDGATVVIEAGEIA